MDADSDPTVLAQEFKMLHAAGADSVRFDVYWQSLEWTSRGSYDANVLARMDAVFAAASSQSLKVILDVWATPCWASSAPATVTLGCASGWWTRPVNRYPPIQASDYADVAAFVVNRWGRSLAALELWNEPNGNFLISQDAARDYARLVQAAYPAAKAAAPSVPVIMSIAGTDAGFLSALYANGVRGYYDGIAVHPYGDSQLRGLRQFRSVQTAQGDGTPLWVTEVGWPSNLGGELGQAQDLTSIVDQLAALPYVAAVEVYEMRDEGTSSSPEDHFGLLDMNLNPKPAWAAFVSALKQLRQPGTSGVQPATAPGATSSSRPLKPQAKKRSRHATRGRSGRRHQRRHRRHHLR